MIFLLTGSSCAGKTTLARACADHPDLVVADFDEIGVPSEADQRWRQRTLEHWVRRALEHQRAGRSLLLTGQSPLGELLACPSATELDGMAVALVDVADRVRWERLEQRDPGRWDDTAKRRFIGWARWHRAHAADPRSRPEVLTTGAWEAMHWQRWSGWVRPDPRWGTTLIDTGGRTVADAADDVRVWVGVAQEMLAAGRLPLARGWPDS